MLILTIEVMYGKYIHTVATLYCFERLAYSNEKFSAYIQVCIALNFMTIIFQILRQNEVLVRETNPMHADRRGFLRIQRGIGIY